MNRVLEPSEPAFRNGTPSRRLQAQEENTSVGRRMVHFLLVIQLLAVHSSWALQSAPGRHSCFAPSGAENLSGAQPACTCCLSVSAPTSSAACRVTHLRPLWHLMHCLASTDPQPTFLRSCLSKRSLVGHCPCAWQFPSRKWLSEDVAARGHRQVDRRRRGLWPQRWRRLRPGPDVPSMEKTQMTPFTSPALMKMTPRPEPFPRQPRTQEPRHRRDLRDLRRLLLQGHRRSACLLYPRFQHQVHRLQPLRLQLRQLQERFRESLQLRRLRPLPRPRDHTCRSPCLTPWSTTSTLSFGQTRGSVVGRMVLQTNIPCCCHDATGPLRVRKTRNVPTLFAAGVTMIPALGPVGSHSAYPRSGPSPSMASSMPPAQPTAGCQDCQPVRGCSPVQQGLHVAKCPYPHASTGGPARGLFLIIVPWSLPDLVRRWPDCSGDPTIRSTHMAIPVSTHTCSGGGCLYPRSGAQPWTCDTYLLSALTVRGLTRDNCEQPEVIRPACVYNPVSRLSFLVSGAAETSHTAAITWYFSLLLSFKDLSSNPSSPRAFFHRSLPEDYRVTQVGSEVLPWCSAAMPRPEPPVKRHRYKPGKRERQERREQKAAAKAAWTARRATQSRRPRPVTV